MPPGTHPGMEEGIRVTYMMREVPRECPKCGSAHIVKVTRSSADHHAWICTQCCAGMEVPVKWIKEIMTGNRGARE